MVKHIFFIICASLMIFPAYPQESSETEKKKNLSQSTQRKEKKEDIITEEIPDMGFLFKQVYYQVYMKDLTRTNELEVKSDNYFNPLDLSEGEKMYFKYLFERMLLSEEESDVLRPGIGPEHERRIQIKKRVKKQLNKLDNKIAKKRAIKDKAKSGLTIGTGGGATCKLGWHFNFFNFLALEPKISMSIVPDPIGDYLFSTSPLVGIHLTALLYAPQFFGINCYAGSEFYINNMIEEFFDFFNRGGYAAGVIIGIQVRGFFLESITYFSMIDPDILEKYNDKEHTVMWRLGAGKRF
ncbi:hypothetical protein ACFL6D_04815 [Spirochaetota bacterium]